MDLVAISDIAAQDILAIWSLVGEPRAVRAANVAWSFEGNGIRTRTSFIRAFRELGMQYTELPNLLRSEERATDLAGYLDPFFDLYVIRHSDHDRLRDFADASARPVINAMSSNGHPCEVLTDAFYLTQRFGNLKQIHICLWGPTTNVFQSWHELATLLGLRISQVCEERFHDPGSPIELLSRPPGHVDVVITDSWPADIGQSDLALSAGHLSAMGDPVLLPTPPFTVGRELLLDPSTYGGFAGYQQKHLLLSVQKAILCYLAEARS